MSKATLKYTFLIWLFSTICITIYFNWIAYPYLINRVEILGERMEILVGFSDIMVQNENLVLTIVPSIFIFGIVVQRIRNNQQPIFRKKIITLFITCFLLIFICKKNLDHYLEMWQISSSSKRDFIQMMYIVSVAIFSFFIVLLKYPSPSIKVNNDDAWSDIEHLVE